MKILNKAVVLKLQGATFANIPTKVRRTLSVSSSFFHWPGLAGNTENNLTCSAMGLSSPGFSAGGPHVREAPRSTAGADSLGSANMCACILYYVPEWSHYYHKTRCLHFIYLFWGFFWSQTETGPSCGSIPPPGGGRHPDTRCFTVSPHMDAANLFTLVWDIKVTPQQKKKKKRGRVWRPWHRTLTLLSPRAGNNAILNSSEKRTTYCRIFLSRFLKWCSWFVKSGAALLLHSGFI